MATLLSREFDTHSGTLGAIRARLERWVDRGSDRVQLHDRTMLRRINAIVLALIIVQTASTIARLIEGRPVAAAVIFASVPIAILLREWALRGDTPWRLRKFIHLGLLLVATIVLTLAWLEPAAWVVPASTLALLPMGAIYMGNWRCGVAWLFMSTLLFVLLYTVGPVPHPSVITVPVGRVLQGQLIDMVFIFIFAFALSRASDRQIEDVVSSEAKIRAQSKLLATQAAQLEKYASALEHARDEAIDASEVKSRFMANMSHEIRTPMNGVLGMTEVLAHTELSDTQRDYVETIKDSGIALMHVINSILDFSKLEGGFMPLENDDFSLRDAVDDITALFGQMAAEKGIEFATDVAEDVPDTVFGDHARLRQVLSNLVSNSIKFTDHGSVRLGVSAVPLGIRFEVADTGIGIGDDVIDTLFSPFVQADDSTARRFGGSGLGLAICKELVELMGGEIGCESEAGNGSCFFFELPLDMQRAGAENIPCARDEDDAPGTIDGLNVLVVEDDPVSRRVVVEHLTKLNADVTAVISGRDALRALDAAAWRFDAILMDCHLPGMDGWETTREIRRREAERSLSRVPVVAITANATEDDPARCAAAEMDGFLPKPYTYDQLVRMLAQHARAAARSA